MKGFLATFLILLAGLAIGQSKKKPTPNTNVLTGKWEGVFTQDRNGQRVDFKAIIYFEQKGNKVTGKSYVFDGDIHAEMLLEGTLRGNKLLRYTEIKIDKQELRPQMEWCVKKCDLSLKYIDNEWVLEGLWEGATTFGGCTPGRVFLKKPAPRA